MQYLVEFYCNGNDYSFSVSIDDDHGRVLTKEDDCRILGDFAHELIKDYLNKENLVEGDVDGNAKCFPKYIRLFRKSNGGEATLLWDANDFQETGQN